MTLEKGQPERNFYVANCLERICELALRLPADQWRKTFCEMSEAINASEESYRRIVALTEQLEGMAKRKK